MSEELAAASTRRRPRWWLPAGLLVATALLAGGGWQWLLRDRVDPGMVAQEGTLRTAERSGETAVELPDAALTVHVRSGVEGRVGDRIVKAPRGGRLVEVSYVMRTVALRASLDPTSRVMPAELRLASGGASVSVDSDITPASSRALGRPALLAVPGDAADLQLFVEYAGREQSVEVFTGRRSPGSFATLYSPASTNGLRAFQGRRPPTNESNGRLTWMQQASGSSWRTPYLPQQGWAAPGREWVVLGRLGLVVWDPTGVDDTGPNGIYRRIPGPAERAQISPGPGARLIGSGAMNVDHDPALQARADRVVIEVQRGAPASIRLTLTVGLARWSIERQEPVPGTETTLTAGATVELPATPVIAEGAT